jgi:hypothetical protein
MIKHSEKEVKEFARTFLGLSQTLGDHMERMEIRKMLVEAREKKKNSPAQLSLFGAQKGGKSED